MPVEYLDWLMCKELGCLPEDLRRMPQREYLMCREFMQLEAKSGRLKQQQAAFYG